MRSTERGLSQGDSKFETYAVIGYRTITWFIVNYASLMSGSKHYAQDRRLS
jgi:hypothetical protein